MVLWFVLRARSMFRFVEPVVGELRRGGNTVYVSFALRDDDADTATVRASGASLVPLELASHSVSARALDLIRNLASYTALRRRWPPLLRERWLDYFPSKVVRAIRLLEAAKLSSLLDNRLLARALAAAARRWPLPRALRRQLKAVSPDVVVASPLIFPGSRESDLVRVAEAAGVPTVGLVLSWDNLTSKGIFHALPDRLFVWNRAQEVEALEWHGIDGDRVDVLGAPVFDYLFEFRDRHERAEALASMGLAGDARFVLYAGSSRIGLGPGGEVEIVRQLQHALEAADWSGASPPVLLVRPHPGNQTGWDLLASEGILVWPRPAFPESNEAKEALVAMVANADAVVGLNTSLFIDGAVLGTPTIALRLDEYGDQLPSRLTHFEHLVRAGFLVLVDSVDDVVRALVRLRSDGDDRRAEREAFVREFVRPLGLERPAAHLVAERLASLR